MTANQTIVLCFKNLQSPKISVTKSCRISAEFRKEFLDRSGRDAFIQLSRLRIPGLAYPFDQQGAKSSTFSNWYRCQIPLGNTTFTSSETVIFAACKAALFNDAETLQEILNDPGMSPKDAKAMGRIVKNFDADIWSTESLWISDLVILLKCLHNSLVVDELFRTGNMILCEASPRDVIWGVGASAKQVEVCLNPKRWKGKNELGKSLMRVRDFLFKILRSESIEDVEFIVPNEKYDMFLSWFE
ncbi:hypothetical protein BDR26DRAFT_894216 [Obelidium mucronatum]|nr:hypothetical protein BDR26DRAFT_894216 [Obelidium mucronatum]